MIGALLEDFFVLASLKALLKALSCWILLFGHFRLSESNFTWERCSKESGLNDFERKNIFKFTLFCCQKKSSTDQNNMGGGGNSGNAYI